MESSEPAEPVVKFEVVFDPVWEACANGLQMDGSRHRILPDGDFILWVRRHYQRPSLFEYEHLETGTLVLADWIYPPMFAQELESYPPRNRPSREYLDARLVTAEQMVNRVKRNLRKSADLKQQIKEARHDTRMAAASRLKKAGLELEALRMEMGATPVQAEMEDPEGFGVLHENLKRIKAGRIYSHG
jgi:hypothetical protein